MDARNQPLPIDARAIRGLSEKLLTSHHENNYGGAVKRLNAIRAQLATLPFPSAPGFAINGLKREELNATNSMILHELYFDSLGGDGTTMEPAMALALTANFGSFERWRDEFSAMAKALSGGSGWVLLVFHPREGTLVNQWASDHTQAIAGGVPIAALDMYEHSYHMDFGAAAARYVDVVMANLDWARIYARYKAAVEAASERFAASQDDISSTVLLDVRRAGVFDKASTVIPGSQWRDPAQVAEWAQEQESTGPVVVYCVYGHEVGRATALRLRAAGIDARFLRGGIDGWEKAGHPLSRKP